MKKGQSKFYRFGYDEYEEERIRLLQNEPQANFFIVNHGEQAKVEKPKEEKNYFNPGKEKAKQERKLAKLEEKIAAAEGLIADYQTQMADPELSSNYVRLNELQKLIETEEEHLEQLMEEYMELSD